MEEDYQKSFSGNDSEGPQPSRLADDESTIEVSEEEFAYFVWVDSRKYIKAFRKFNIDGVDKFSITWNWAAFFFTFFWMACRKIYSYSWALIGFVLLCPFNYAPFIIVMIFFGVTGNYIYYKHAKKKILKLKRTKKFSDSREMLMAMKKEGDVNVVLIMFFIVIAAILFSYVLLMYLFAP
jgi:hypothetical protein